MTSSRTRCGSIYRILFVYPPRGTTGGVGLGGTLVGTNPRARELSRCGSPKTLLPQMPLAPLRRGFSSPFGDFEEPPRMSSEGVACLRKADEAKQRAAQATEPSIKSAYEKVAEHWMLLARLESLVAAEKNSEDA